MHREVLGLKKGDGLHGDHINGDTLDNRRINLRVVTNLQNSYNQKIAKNNTTGFKGVVRRRNGWECYIQAEGKKKYLGFSPTKEGAGELYRVASLDLHGEFARTQ